MPKVTIWIKKEDYPFWQEIQDRPSFIHDAIRVQRQTISGSIYTSTKEIKPKYEHASTLNEYFGKVNNQCPHHGTQLTDFGKCLVKGCKYKKGAK